MKIELLFLMRDFLMYVIGFNGCGYFNIKYCLKIK